MLKQDLLSWCETVDFLQCFPHVDFTALLFITFRCSSNVIIHNNNNNTPQDHCRSVGNTVLWHLNETEEQEVDAAPEYFNQQAVWTLLHFCNLVHTEED